MTLRYEGVRFSDGSVAVRRVSADPCARATLTFESVQELEEDIGIADVMWIVDRGAGSTRPPAPIQPCSLGLAHDGLRPGMQRPACSFTAPIKVTTEEDWRKHVGGQPPACFLAAPAEQAFVVVPTHVEPATTVDEVNAAAAQACPFWEDPPAVKRAYFGDGHPAVRAAELDRYVPEPEDVESI